MDFTFCKFATKRCNLKKGGGGGGGGFEEKGLGAILHSFSPLLSKASLPRFCFVDEANVPLVARVPIYLERDLSVSSFDISFLSS